MPPSTTRSWAKVRSYSAYPAVTVQPKYGKASLKHSKTASQWFRGTVRPIQAPRITRAYSLTRVPGRGFGRSFITGAQDYSLRLETDADDAARLIQKYSPSEPATAIGNSSGAIVSLMLLTRHPNLLHTVISYEPPLARVLPDFHEIWATHEDIYATYRASGMVPAYEKFGKLIKRDVPLGMVARMTANPENPYVFSNMMYWFEREFNTYPQHDFDVERELAPWKGKLVLFCGEGSNREAYQYRGNVALGKKLGLEVVHVPGEHVGHTTHAKEFAEKVAEMLKGRDE
jgi:pimeloyl-ACP methyl ester carboxylesterase